MLKDVHNCRPKGRLLLFAFRPLREKQKTQFLVSFASCASEKQRAVNSSLNNNVLISRGEKHDRCVIPEAEQHVG